MQCETLSKIVSDCSDCGGSIGNIKSRRNRNQDCDQGGTVSSGADCAERMTGAKGAGCANLTDRKTSACLANVGFLQ
jgi:hypothetical protein